MSERTKATTNPAADLLAQIARLLVSNEGKPQLNADSVRLLLDQQRVLLDAQKLEVERQKARNDQYKNFLDQWRTDVGPLDAAASLSRQFAVQFAQSALRTVFLLNGGAFVAVPAFAKLVDASIKHELTYFIKPGRLPLRTGVHHDRDHLRVQVSGL